MLMLVGLGNYGEAYAYTRHNAGSIVLREMVRRQGGQWQSFTPKKTLQSSLKRRWFRRTEKSSVVAEVSVFTLWKEKVVAVIPCSLMNICGEPVERVRNFYKIPSAQVIVIHDDLDMLPGRIKFRKGGGGTGGHNGIRSLERAFGDGLFSRIKVGIGHPATILHSSLDSHKHKHKHKYKEVQKTPPMPVNKWVLSDLSEAELESLRGDLVDQSFGRIRQMLSQ